MYILNVMENNWKKMSVGEDQRQTVLLFNSIPKHECSKVVLKS